MKTEFELEPTFEMIDREWKAVASIVGDDKDAHISITVYNTKAKAVHEHIVSNPKLKGKSLETFALNILKALKSNKLAK